MKIFYAFSLILVCCTCAINKVDYSGIIRPEIGLAYNQFDSINSLLYTFHPNPFGDIPKNTVDSLVTMVIEENTGRSLTVPEWITELRSVYDIVTFNDPHFSMVPVLRFSNQDKVKYDRIRVLPFDVIISSNRFFVNHSEEKSIVKGDRILSINGVNITDFEENYNSIYRYAPGYELQAHMDFLFAPEYNIVMQRGVDILKVNTKGVELGRFGMGDYFYEEKFYSDYRTGYFRIKQFINNPYILKKLIKHIDKSQKYDFHSIIIDVRNNPGGSGEDLEAFFSLFSNADSLDYMSSQYLKVSSETIDDYSFVKDSMGSVVRFHDSEIYRKLYLDPQMYKGSMNYYLLVDKGTSSMAASFANVMHYNKLATLVGEPLLNNALKYGEVLDKSIYGLINVGVSTVEYNELSCSQDGVLYPDIIVDYDAIDNFSEDFVLKMLLEKIKKTSSSTE